MDSNTENNQKTPNKGQEPILDYLLEYFTSNPKRQIIILSFLVLNALPDITSEIFKGLRKKGKTYGEISAFINCGLNRGTIHKIENKIFFPKKPARQLELLKKVLELI